MSQYPGEKSEEGEFRAWSVPEHHWASHPGAAVERMDPAKASLIAYLLAPVLGGVIFYLLHRDVEVRFHAAQSMLFSVALAAFATAAGVLLGGLAWLGLGFIVSRFVSLVGVLALVAWIVLSVQGYRRQHLKLPLLGDLAERLAVAPGRI